MRQHQFVDDPELRDDRTGEQWCLCGLPYGNTVHRIRQRTEDERSQEARRMGERD